MVRLYLLYIVRIYTDLKSFFFFFTNMKFILWFFILPLTTLFFFIFIFLIIINVFKYFFIFIYNIFFKKINFNLNLNTKKFENIFYIYLYDFFYILPKLVSFNLIYIFFDKLINFRNREKKNYHYFIFILLSRLFNICFRILTTIPYKVFSINVYITKLLYNLYKANKYFYKFGFFYFFSKKFYYDFYISLYKYYINNLKVNTLNNKVYWDNGKIIFNMRRLNFTDFFGIKNTARLTENNICLNELGDHIIPCKMLNTTSRGKQIPHMGEHYLLKDGSSLLSSETTKEYTPFYDDSKKKWDSYKNTFTSQGNKDINKEVYTGPLSYTENFDKWYGEDSSLKDNNEKILVKSRPFYDQELNLKELQNLRNNKNYISNAMNNHIKIEDSIVLKHDSKGVLLKYTEFNNYKDFMNSKKDLFPDYYNTLFYNLCSIIKENPDLFNNLNVTEKEQMLKFMHKEYFNKNDLINFKTLAKKTSNDKILHEILDNF